MLDCRTKLCVIYDDSVDQTDYSFQAADFVNNTFNAILDVNQYLYIGYKKPINTAYIYMTVANTQDVNLVAEYYNGTSWQPLEICDETNDLKQTSIISYSIPEDLADFTIVGKTQCFIRLSADGPTDEITFKAINILFSDDSDIAIEFPGLLQECYYPEGETNFIKYHVTARNYIMQRLKSLGYIKDNDDNINEWDVLDIFELRQASLYYAMSQIFFNLSDNTDDNLWQKYEEYTKKFEEAMALGALRIDKDGDGRVDKNEIRPIKTVRWVR